MAQSVAAVNKDAIWAINSENVHGDWRRNAGAGTSVTRRRIQIRWGAPAFIETNARIGFLNVAGTRLYLFPDRLLVLGNGGVREVPYEDLSVKASTVSFREEGGVTALHRFGLVTIREPAEHLLQEGACSKQ